MVFPSVLPPRPVMRGDMALRRNATLYEVIRGGWVARLTVIPLIAPARRGRVRSEGGESPVQ